MAFPIIPVLALLGIAGGIAALGWYVNLSQPEQEKADRLALKWFGRRFRDLAEYQQERIRQHLS